MRSNRIQVRAATPNDFEFAYQVKKAALGPYITEVFGWNEVVQRAFHQEEFDYTHTTIIMDDNVAVGWFAVTTELDHLWVHAIYLMPTHQGRGIGTALLQEILHDAQLRRLPVRLGCLKVNPARQLYERYGFRVVEEDEHFLYLEKEVE